MIRHRGGGSDEYGDPRQWTDAPLIASVVAPGASREYVERGRNGSNVAFTVYFRPAVDLVDADELTVRGARFTVEVDDWVFGSATGTVANCVRGQG